MTAAKKISDLKKPNIFSYHDYREFLKDWVMFKKQTQSKFSLRSFSVKSNISASQFNMIINGHRNLTSNNLKLIAKQIKLNVQEVSYFGLLVNLADSKSDKERVETLSKLQKFKKYRDNHKDEFETYKYLQKWYFVAIKEMINLKGFKLEPKWIQARLQKKVSLLEIKRAINFLQDYNFIKINKDGTVESTEKLIRCMSGVYKLSLTTFHQQVLELGIESISTVDREKRNILGHTTTLATSQIDTAKQILNEALEKIERLGEETSANEGDEVYHFELLTFPLTKEIKDKKK